MTYLVADDLPTIPAGERFRKLLDRPGILQVPGAHCGLAALQAKAAQFEALYLSGAAMSASMGLPDLGILTIDDGRYRAPRSFRCWWTAIPALAKCSMS
jgi:methylisocitrate lyase